MLGNDRGEDGPIDVGRWRLLGPSLAFREVDACRSIGLFLRISFSPSTSAIDQSCLSGSSNEDRPIDQSDGLLDSDRSVGLPPPVRKGDEDDDFDVDIFSKWDRREETGF